MWLPLAWAALRGIMRHHSNHSDTRMESDNLNILNRASHEGQSLVHITILQKLLTTIADRFRLENLRYLSRSEAHASRVVAVRRQRLLTSVAVPRKPQRTSIDVAIIAIVTVRNPIATKLSCHG